jgi:hypothetical protein
VSSPRNRALQAFIDGGVERNVTVVEKRRERERERERERVLLPLAAFW